VTLSFSELKYLFECPYQFKLRFLYGFNPPLHEALGYGKGLHDALAEVHKRAITGDVLTPAAAEELVERHLYTPFAYPQLREVLEKSAADAIRRYFARHGHEISSTIHSEKQIQVHAAPGVTVDGRIDLIRRLDTDELAVVDFKSTDRAQAEEVTRDQLHVYALGYQELTGDSADLIEVLNLDEDGKNTRETVEDQLLTEVRERITAAGESLRTNSLPRLQTWCQHCDRCDLAAICRDAPSQVT
jgi:DNA helicase-2/ATP-dependent DNA helicase PcrA